ncbi:MAG: hypothetical protein U9Q63_00945 [Patescibacteria group bacterium]|nr:hypothetical protein [Patescibacteria group bacterium]
MTARRKIIIFSAIIGAIFFGNTRVYGAMVFEITGIEGSPSEIKYDQEIEVLYSFTDIIPTKTYYLQGVFQKNPGDYYFGYTWNDNWYKYGDDFTNYYKLEITESSASGKLKVKPDVDSSGFFGTGDYKLKLNRFCSSKSACGNTNTVSIKIVAPATPSPTPSPSPSPTPTPTPSASPTPSPSPTPKFSPEPARTDPAGVEGSESGELTRTILVSSGSGEVKGTSEAGELNQKKDKSYFISIILIILGLGLVSGTGVVFYKQGLYN